MYSEGAAFASDAGEYGDMGLGGGTSIEDQLIAALKHKVSMLESQNKVLEQKLEQKALIEPSWTPEHTDRLVR